MKGLDLRGEADARTRIIRGGGAAGSEELAPEGEGVVYGTKGSVRLDVLDVSANVVYDYKFVLHPPGLSRRQVERIQTHGPQGAQIVEVNP